jgi:hypothetical protein
MSSQQSARSDAKGEGRAFLKLEYHNKLSVTVTVTVTVIHIARLLRTWCFSFGWWLPGSATIKSRLSKPPSAEAAYNDVSGGHNRRGAVLCGSICVAAQGRYFLVCVGR